MRSRDTIAQRFAVFLFIAAALYTRAGYSQTGWIDGGYWANNQFYVSGWACDYGSPWSVMVTVIDPYTGEGFAGGVADQWSEPAVADACGIPGYSNFRFAIPMPGWKEETLIGQGMAVVATSNYTDYEGSPYRAYLADSWSIAYPDNRIHGWIDVVSSANDQVTIAGWSCTAGVEQSVWVHVYAGGPAGSGQWVTAALANGWSEPAVAADCNVSSGAYRYHIVVPFGPEQMMQMGGLKVYVHGISLVGSENLLLGNSGAFSLPGQKASVNGGCGYVPAVWNAPYGALVLTRSNGGPIKPVIDAVGEYYTHSMLSLGTNGIAHAEMRTPDKNSYPAVCTRPLNPSQLQYGYPGAEQINLGGAYADLQGGEITPRYQWGDPSITAAIANWVMAAPQTTSPSQSNSSIWIPRKMRNGSAINYSLYQYRNIEQTNQFASSSVNNGMVCSTFLSWLHVQAGAGFVSAFTYAHDKVAAGATALFNAVQRDCNMQSADRWWTRRLIGISCPFYNVCENAGDQATNCMSSNACDTNDNAIWHGVRDNPGATATSISPDRLSGHRSPHDQAPTTVWWYDRGDHPIAWNGPGSQYGCWY